MLPAKPDLSSDQDIKSILEWLALAHGQHGIEGVEDLHVQLVTLRSAALPTPQRVKLLDLLFSHATRIVNAQLPSLHELSLPVSRKVRQRVRATQDLLDMFAQDYLNTLAELFDPDLSSPSKQPAQTLSRVIQCFGWQLLTSHLVAAPAALGLWQKIHAAYASACRLGIADLPIAGLEQTITEAYLTNLLPAIAQPASFTSRELEFIYAYAAPRIRGIKLSTEVPLGNNGVFWIDQSRDLPANALLRRSPPPETEVLYFACDVIAGHTADYVAALEKGKLAEELGLPEFADSLPGQGVLRRLAEIWGHPAKRRYPRRKQSHRARLCVGLEDMWQLLDDEASVPITSEWMITNESPDGYAMMHMSGDTHALRVGDVVAAHPVEEQGITQSDSRWHICIIRWALSENPEHVEIGLQILSPKAIPATLATPLNVNGNYRAAALLLPETPPLRPYQALIVPTGTISNHSHKLILLLEQENLEIREVRTTSLDEQTSCIEVFSVESDERP